jgi:nitrite reductase (NO-forming)
MAIRPDPSPAESGLTRRSLLRRSIIAAGGVSAAAVAAWSPAVQAASRIVPARGPDRTLQATEPTVMPAKPITAPEISLHPAGMPRSADYARYVDGEYLDQIERTGPMTHEVRVTSSQVVAEVMPGTTMDLWTFDGRIPGPMIRVRVGDTVDFFLKNDATSSMPHNVDFHAVNGPGGGAMRLDTLPGSESELRFKLLNPGIYIYHCAFPDVPMHIAHGMYGLIVVEPEGGLPAVDHEFYVMQHEFYTDRGGSLPAAALADAGHLPYSDAYGNEERPTFVMFNGRPGAITGERAIGKMGEPVNTGETVRLFVGNIGPNLISSFHVIGEIFDSVYVEGSFDLVNHNVQSTVIPCGGAAGVEFRVEVPGTYLLVDHAIFRTHKGAAGELVVGGEAEPGVFEPVKSDPIRTTESH